MVEINNTTKQKINLFKTRQIVERFLTVYKKPNWEVSVAVVGEVRMRQLNFKYRQIDKTTDVLSFRGGEAMNKFLGEIIINVAETKRPAKYEDVFGVETKLGHPKPSLLSSRQDVSFKRGKKADVWKKPDYIFYFLLIHGLLHLMGYNDEVESGRLEMISLGRKFLEEIF